jgi:cytochrome c-type biogenesis protein
MDPGTLILLASESDLAVTAERLIAESPWLAPLAVFGGGLVTAANPCVIATVPLLMAYVGGRDDVRTFGRGVALSTTFVAGLSCVFAALGIVAALAGTMLGESGPVWDYVVLAVCLLMAAHLVGWIEVPVPNMTVTPRLRGLPGAFLLGGLFGVVSSPCATPILLVVLAYVASSDASPAYGALLLGAYAFGHSLLILIAGVSAGFARSLVRSERFERAGRVLRAGAGVLIAGVGIVLFLSR